MCRQKWMTFLVISCALSAGCSPKPQTPAEENSERGERASDVHELQANCTKKEFSGDAIAEETTFDAQGDAVKVRAFLEGSEVYTIDTQFDANHIPVTRTLVRDDGIEKAWEFDAKGRETRFAMGDSDIEITHVDDGDNYLETWVEQGGDSPIHVLTKKVVWTSENVRTTYDDRYDGDELVLSSEQVMDEQGRMIEDISYWYGSMSDELDSSRIVYTLDNLGQPLTMTSVNSATEYVYDADQRLNAVKVSDENGVLVAQNRVVWDCE